MKIVCALTLFYSGLSLAEIWEKPPYRPDENHLPHIIYQRQAQEEAPGTPVKQEKKKDQEKKPKKKSAK